MTFAADMVSPLEGGAARSREVEPSGLSAHFGQVRAATVELTVGLDPEDLGIQSMADASPIKWHLAHTAWFFETFVLRRYAAHYRPLDERYATLFNSYYVGVGQAHARGARGVLSRPGVEQVLAYRTHVDAAIEALIAGPALSPEAYATIELGLHHEQQHQELILTDLCHAFSCNPIAPVYRDRAPQLVTPSAPLRWIGHGGGLLDIGHTGRGFAFDNEGPSHKVWLDPFAIASRPASCRDFLEFMHDGGYHRPELWMSLGWELARARGWDAPAYWRFDGEAWSTFSLAGVMPLDLEAPVCNVSWFEADAFARWSNARLPTEAQWEAVAGAAAVVGNFVESGALAPHAGRSDSQTESHCGQLFGDVWEWTASAYSPYPGYQPTAGVLGEYNGKFMCGPYVLRGGSCLSPASHLRATYRNYFAPDTRWQFSGIRLARDP